MPKRSTLSPIFGSKDSFRTASKKFAKLTKDYRLDNAANAIYSFVWNEYCDWCLELAKVQLNSENPAIERATRNTLVTVLETVLRLAHPIIPFITEELWQTVSVIANARKADEETSIMIQEYPKYDASQVNAEADFAMNEVKAMIDAIRNLRGEMKISPSTKVPLAISCKDGTSRARAESLDNYLKVLGKLSEVIYTDDLDKARPVGSLAAPVAVVNDFSLMLIVKVDIEAEKSSPE